MTQEEKEREALALLQDWRNTPGNWRKAAWWNNWIARMEAITEHPGEYKRERN